MRTGAYKLAVQQGATAVYAEVELEIDAATDGDGPSVEFDPSVHTQWRSAAVFGIEYASGQRCRSDRTVPNERTKVTFVGTAPVDTNLPAVALASAYAYWKAIGVLVEDGPRVNPNDLDIVFPKCVKCRGITRG